MVERWTVNPLVIGSTPIKEVILMGSMPERLKGLDCKSIDVSLHRFESYSAQL